MTPELIAACTGGSLYLSTRYWGCLLATMTEFEINTLTRQAAFLAQIGHESEGLLFFKELWGANPSESQARYERDITVPWPSSPAESREEAFKVNRLAYMLGNSEPGDGKRFMGRGPIQITGRRNYGVMGPKLGLDLIQFPTLIEDSMHACRSAGAFWQWKDCNDFADSNDFIGLTRRINGGTNGLTDRLARWAKAKAALGLA